MLISYSFICNGLIKQYKSALIRRPLATRNTMTRITSECAVLKEGDLVLVRINVRGTDHKITDKWEQAPCEVVITKPDSPLIKIRNTATSEVRELHRNMLYPLHMVDRNDESEDAAPVLAKANIVMDTYFACDCKNCRDTI